VELTEYLRVLRRRWWLVALGLLVCVGAAAAATFTQAPRYRASTRLLVSGSSSVSAIDEISRRQLADQRAVAYSQIASTGPAIQAAVQAAGVKTGVSVVASADTTSPFIRIAVTGRSSHDVAAVANVYVTTLPTVVTRLDQTPSAAPPELSVLEAASIPTTPASPKPKRNLLVGLVAGIILGVAAALIREAMDPRLRDSAEIERATEVGVLGVVPREFADEELTALTRPRSQRSEAYRQIRTNLEFTGAEGAPRSFVITSAGPGEGKTTVAANVALIESHTGKSVVIVDADLRKPRVHELYQVPDRPGLTDVLAGRISLEDGLQRLEGETLSILTSGPRPTSPSELLGSSAMVELIQELERRFDLVVIDTPPVLPVTDALVLAVNTGGAVIVTRLGNTSRTALRRAVQAVAKVHATILGVVGNAAIEQEERHYGYGYGYGYGHGYLQATPANTEDLRPAEHLRPAGRRPGNGRAAANETGNSSRLKAFGVRGPRSEGAPTHEDRPS
jgi:capsular exopolysaccharide synthesis family protein